MKRIHEILIGLVVGALAGLPAHGAIINGELKNAQLENLSSDPATTTAGRVYYNTTTKTPRVYKDGIGWADLGSGTGSGSGTNYVQNPNDDTEWSGTATITTSTSSSEVPRPQTVGSGIKIVATAGQTGLLCVDIDALDYELPKMLKAAYDYNLVAGDFTVDVSSFSAVSCGGTETPLNLSTDDPDTGISTLDVLGYSSVGPGHTYSSRTDTRSLQLKLTAGGSGGTIVLSGVEVGPGSGAGTGAVVEGWQTFTPELKAVTTDPVLGTGGSVTQIGFWRKVGDSLEMEVRLRFGTSGASFGSGIWYVALPGGLTVDADVVNVAGVVGHGYAQDDGAAVRVPILPLFSSSITPNGIYFNAMESSAGAGGALESSVPFTWATSDHFSFRATVPIAEWSGSATYNIGSDSVAYSNARMKARHTTGQAIAEDTVTQIIFDDEEYDTANAYDPVTGTYTAPADGWYRIRGLYRYSSTTQATHNCYITLNSNAETRKLVSTDYKCDIGDTLQLSAGDEVGISTFQSTSASEALEGTAVYSSFTVERVSEHTVNSSLLFGQATSEMAGLYVAGQAPGITDGSDACEGCVGEYFEVSPGSAVAASGCNAYQTITSYTLDPGDWDIHGGCTAAGTGMTGFLDWRCTISTIDNSTDSVAVDAFVSSDFVKGSGSHDPRLNVGPRRVNITSPTTIYLIGRLDCTSIGSVEWSTVSKLWGRRVR